MFDCILAFSKWASYWPRVFLVFIMAISHYSFLLVYFQVWRQIIDDYSSQLFSLFFFSRIHLSGHGSLAAVSSLRPSRATVLLIMKLWYMIPSSFMHRGLDQVSSVKAKSVFYIFNWVIFWSTEQFVEENIMEVDLLMWPFEGLGMLYAVVHKYFDYRTITPKLLFCYPFVHTSS
jgi:hypothetical protein